jgi:hypothetical protein
MQVSDGHPPSLALGRARTFPLTRPFLSLTFLPILAPFCSLTLHMHARARSLFHCRAQGEEATVYMHAFLESKSVATAIVDLPSWTLRSYTNPKMKSIVLPPSARFLSPPPLPPTSMSIHMSAQYLSLNIARVRTHTLLANIY